VKQRIDPTDLGPVKSEAKKGTREGRERQERMVVRSEPIPEFSRSIERRKKRRLSDRLRLETAENENQTRNPFTEIFFGFHYCIQERMTTREVLEF